MAEVLFRPEAASFVPLEAASLRGRVAGSHFLGDRTKILVEGIGEQTVVIESSERTEFAVGAEIGLNVQADGLMLLD